MNLILHQVFKDLRMTRILLGAFWATLGLDLAISQEWIGAPVWEWPYTEANSRSVWQQFTPLLNLMFGAILTLTVVVTDTPARENGFLRTRPMPVSAIWFGKLIFVTAFILLPSLLELSLHLLLSKVSGPDFGGILLERISLILPLALLLGGLAAGTINNARAQNNLVAMTIAFLIGMGLLGLISAVHYLAPGGLTEIDIEPSRLRFSVAMAIAGSGLLAAAVSFVRLRPSTGRQSLITAGIGLASILSFLIVPKDVPLAPLAQAEIDRVIAGTQFTIPHGAISLGESSSSAGHLTGRRTLSVQLDTAMLPPAWALEATPTPIRLAAAGAHATSAAHRNRNAILESQANLGFGDARSIRESLPEATLLSFSSLYGSTDQSLSVTGGEITLPANDPLWEEPAGLSLTARTRVYRWQLAARMPLAKPVSHTDAHGSWQLVTSRYDTNSQAWHIVLKRTQLWREFSSDPEQRDFSRWPGNRHQFLFFDPQTKTVHQYYVHPQAHRAAGRHNGFGSAYVLLSYVRTHEHEAFQPADPTRLELLVMKKAYLGEFSADVSRQVRLPDLLRRRSDSETPRGETLPYADMMRRFRNLEPPPTDASRARIAAHVTDVLQLVTASRFYPEDHDEITTSLAAYVPSQTELFFDGLEATSGSAYRVLETALNRGLTSARRDLLVARLRKDPRLCRFLTDRGWLADARAEVLALLDTDRHLDTDALEALLSFADDPRVLPRLFEELEFHHRVEAYELLARQPGLTDTLDAIVRRMWSRHLPLARSVGLVDEALQIAARHGLPEAHAELLNLFRRLTPEERQRDYSLLNTLRDCTELPGLGFRDRIHRERVDAAIEPLIDRPFRYDTARRLFTTRPAQTLTAKELR